MEPTNHEGDDIQVIEAPQERTEGALRTAQTVVISREAYASAVPTPSRVIPGRPVARPTYRTFYTNQSPLVRLGNNLPAMVPRIDGYRSKPTPMRAQTGLRSTETTAATSNSDTDPLDSTISEVAKAPTSSSTSNGNQPTLSFAVRAGAQPSDVRSANGVRPGVPFTRPPGERRSYYVNGEHVVPLSDDEEEANRAAAQKKTTPVLKPRIINEDHARIVQAKLATARESALKAAKFKDKMSKSPLRKSTEPIKSPPRKSTDPRPDPMLNVTTKTPFPQTINLTKPDKVKRSTLEIVNDPSLSKPRGTMIMDKVYEIRMPEAVTIRLTDEENEIMNRLKAKGTVRTYAGHMDDLRQFKTALSYCSRLIDYQYEIIKDMSERLQEFKKNGDEWRREAKKLQRQVACRIIKPHITKYKTPYSKASRKKKIRAKLKEMVTETFEYNEEDMKKLLRETFPEAFYVPEPSQDEQKEGFRKEDDDEDDEDYIPQHVYMPGQVPHESLYY
ncbi:unnamed protein product [Bursaphelenchus xylophilus]|uniref:(pine wood nematode) hypothetical protein n=1 Tax=Bursaphelenchus xylophilus TaxID=6326 RepID=A0A1I7RI45_BURXY|nr:unnamed protein product [Bursaphelenchus xylophilus]CAG9115163.1 unnamed protein product [Bursaphelenchus xylophilus]